MRESANAQCMRRYFVCVALLGVQVRLGATYEYVYEWWPRLLGPYPPFAAKQRIRSKASPSVQQASGRAGLIESRPRDVDALCRAAQRV